MADVATLVHAHSTSHLKKMLAGERITRRNLLSLRGHMESLSKEEGTSGPAPISTAPSITPVSGHASEAGTGQRVVDSGVEDRSMESADLVSSLSSRAEPTKRDFSVLAHWLRTVRGLSRDAVAQAAGMAGSSSLNQAVRGSVSQLRIDQLWSFVASLGVEPADIVEGHGASVPAAELPVTVAADEPPSDPSDTRQRREFVRIVQQLREEPWAKSWGWFDEVMGYRGRKYTRRLYYTPGAAPDAPKLKKLRRQYREVSRLPAPEDSSQLPLLGDTSSSPAVTPHGRVAVPRLVAPGEPSAHLDSSFATGLGNGNGRHLEGGAAVRSYADLPGLFSAAVSDLDSACENLARIAEILPEMASQPISAFREQLIREADRLRPQQNGEELRRAEE
jgi:transcriptional regulator with XRE-family HTH domain